MKWIDVEKQLPEEGQKVLASDGEDVEIMIYFGTHKGYQEWSSYNCMTIDVHYWMPLPEPPKSKDDKSEDTP